MNGLPQFPPAIHNRLVPGSRSSSLITTVPVLTSNLYPIYGVVSVHWSVADLFFWFWCEFVLAGITTFVLVMAWPNAQKVVPKKLAAFTFGFAFFLILIFATLFAGLAFKGEWGSWSRFPQFLANKEIGLAFLIVSFVVLLGMALTNRQIGPRALEKVSMLFNRKCFIIVGFYVLFLVHGWIREWTTGARSLNLSPTYIKAMGVTLLFLKLLAEQGLFDKLFKRRSTEAIDNARKPDME